MGKWEGKSPNASCVGDMPRSIYWNLLSGTRTELHGHTDWSKLVKRVEQGKRRKFCILEFLTTTFQENPKLAIFFFMEMGNNWTFLPTI